MESISARVQKELVLLHRKNVGHPSGTVKWLNALGWLSAHFHVSYRSARNVCVGVVLTMLFVRAAIMSHNFAPQLIQGLYNPIKIPVFNQRNVLGVGALMNLAKTLIT